MLAFSHNPPTSSIHLMASVKGLAFLFLQQGSVGSFILLFSLPEKQRSTIPVVGKV